MQMHVRQPGSLTLPPQSCLLAACGVPSSSTPPPGACSCQTWAHQRIPSGSKKGAHEIKDKYALRSEDQHIRMRHAMGCNSPPGSALWPGPQPFHQESVPPIRCTSPSIATTHSQQHRDLNPCFLLLKRTSSTLPPPLPSHSPRVHQSFVVCGIDSHLVM